MIFLFIYPAHISCSVSCWGLVYCIALPVPNAKPEYPVLPQALVESCPDRRA
ncbi:hypothetical protein COCVIDRAFT_90667 [Bipolaris victoriae FI3]|uniref:Uncharacterized protein n=1 Tax=Bipolaris victoriae (strain FI3) TaxID=930091 RepID=W7F282_BIPV3|nr:hypothetical protein COCVIDRAFT_90667 [Bipolaris victoriae FI3]